MEVSTTPPLSSPEVATTPVTHDDPENLPLAPPNSHLDTDDAIQDNLRAVSSTLPGTRDTMTFPLFQTPDDDEDDIYETSVEAMHTEPTPDPSSPRRPILPVTPDFSRYPG